MKRANISTTKNNLSKLIDEVRNGEAIVILDRDVPVARLEPIGDLAEFAGRIPALARDGIVAVPEKQLDVEAFLTRKNARLREGASAVRTLLDERSDSR